MPENASALFEQLASIRETLATPIPDLPHHVFLACDCCGARMRTETAFACRDCIHAHGAAGPAMQTVIDRGMTHIAAMHRAATEARAAGWWN
jgi:hypothetical protein